MPTYPQTPEKLTLKRILAGALALAVTGISVPLTLFSTAHAQPGPVTDTEPRTQAVNTTDEQARPHVYRVQLGSWTVASGQNLSTIANERYGQQSAWTLIYWANHKSIKWADRIQIGQVLTLPAWTGYVPAAPKSTSPPVVVVHRLRSAVSAGPYSGTTHRTYIPVSGTYSGSGGMERCIIRAESGGNSQVMNSSGHYGLYQFSYSTWVGSGGSGASFGHASVAEQQRVFQTAVAARGYSDWRPYDGC